MKKMKIAVLYGGPSSEREISLKSGSAVINALNNLKIKNFPVIVNNDLKWVDTIKKVKADFVFIALHGKFGEDGTVQSILEFLKIPYSGSGVLASALSMNKPKAKEIFTFNKIQTPPWRVITRADEIRDFSTPFVVKPIDEGSAIGVSVVFNHREIKAALKTAFKYGKKILVEKYIDGTELTVAILGKTALPVIEIVPKGKFYDFDSKYKPGMSEHIIPARLPKTILKKSQEIALKAFRSLGCKAFGRVDIKVNSEKEIFVLELNTIPGMTQTSLLPDAARAAGLSFEEMILEMIKHSLC